MSSPRVVQTLETTWVIMGKKSPRIPPTLIAGARSDIATLFRMAEEASLQADGTRAMTALHDAYLKAMTVRSTSLAADALYKLARQARLNNDSTASLDFARLIFELPKNGRVSTVFKGHLAIGAHLAYFGRDAEVLSTLRDAESECSSATLVDFSDYLSLRGRAEAMQGNIAESVSNNDIALELSSKRDSPFSYAGKILDAASSAPNLGMSSRARALFERAAETAISNHLGYVIRLSKLLHAWSRLLVGDLDDARGLMETAEQYPGNHIWARVCRSAVGVMLGTLSGDRQIAKHCLDVGALDLAFSSGAGRRIGPIAAAFHEYFLSIGDDVGASEHLSRAVQAISSPDECWWLLLQVASHGRIEDVSRALEILAPYSESFQLAQAHRHLLVGRLARLDGRDGDGRNSFIDAATIFSKLGWQYHYATALRLAASDDAATAEFLRIGARANVYRAVRQTSHTSQTTRRTLLSAQDRDIALFVAQGATNRRIAERLGIAERSVKYHLTAIFNLLGVENRAALAEFVNSKPDWFSLT
jgi:DNA-binding CsgD family transcriptional regulator/tetratricopeptide (TPR) repeat protein